MDFHLEYDSCNNLPLMPRISSIVVNRGNHQLSSHIMTTPHQIAVMIITTHESTLCVVLSQCFPKLKLLICRSFTKKSKITAALLLSTFSTRVTPSSVRLPLRKASLTMASFAARKCSGSMGIREHRAVSMGDSKSAPGACLMIAMYLIDGTNTQIAMRVKDRHTSQQRNIHV